MIKTYLITVPLEYKVRAEMTKYGCRLISYHQTTKLTADTLLDHWKKVNEAIEKEENEEAESIPIMEKKSNETR